MTGKTLIEVSGVGKRYREGASAMKILAGLLGVGAEKQGRWVLQDVSFSINSGEALGVIGRNGAGKSTLLQIMCGTLTPSCGSVASSGRVAAMLELGAGFNPEFTGRENVFLSASLYGLSDRQIKARFRQVAAFADIGEFMDRPVSEYSSGMYARLAFAVCAHVDADVLIIDEILGVGDAAFQLKCRRFLDSFLQHGAIVFVSHDEHAVLSLCNRAIWLEHGRPMAQGAPKDVLRQYRQAHDVNFGAVEKAVGSAAPAVDPARFDFCGQGTNPVTVSGFLTEAPWHGHGGVIIEDVYMSDREGARLERLQGGQIVALHMKGRAERQISRPIAGFIFRNALGQNLFGDNTFLQYQHEPREMAAGASFHAALEFRLPCLPLGTYTIAPSLIDGTQKSHIQLCWIEEALVLTVHESPVSLGLVGVPMRVTAALRSDRSHDLAHVAHPAQTR
ncbi:ABC transporter ATP-binding protein [Pseudorhizobium banfieldiae]|uniref:ABC transporter ATP-binding protein n=1 Tax=Pseudorhizobium banfieldiae TaxID=1125847 RepID=UPI001AEBCBEF|nr:ABC transporter ATP-binding protein [Pseudorhizobium banfieldiae]